MNHFALRASRNINGSHVVEASLPCINGLSAFVTIADLGQPEPADEMFGGLDYEGNARRMAAAWNMCRGVPIDELEKTLLCGRAHEGLMHAVRALLSVMPMPGMRCYDTYHARLQLEAVRALMPKEGT